MPKLRKQRRRKVYKYNVNRKRLRNRISDLGNIGCKEIKNQWEAYKSVKSNLTEMGLSYDPNVTISFPKLKTTSTKVENEEMKQITNSIANNDKCEVANILEADVKAPREKLFRLPKGQVQWITYLIDTYGDDYKAMVRDKKNHNQETWKQLRAKINRFKGIPEQYSEYLNKRNVST